MADTRSLAALLALVAPLALASTAGAQWWWPPDMEVGPPCRSPSSNVIVTLSGQFPTACIPNTFDVAVSGADIDITSRREPPPTFCLQVISSWTAEVPVGTLPAGTYSVYGTHRDQNGPVTQRVLLGNFDVMAACPGECYPNCDGSTAQPVLNVGDFTCFLQRFAAGETYANCDGSTAAPTLNVGDFTCFLQRFAAGCP